MKKGYKHTKETKKKMSEAHEGQIPWNKDNSSTSLEKTRVRSERYRIKTRKMVLIHYSGNPPKCACCGETIYEFLTIDHINGGGTEHKKEIKGYPLAIWLKVNNFPKGFQVLCYNCNCAKGFWGKCPHKKTSGP